MARNQAKDVQHLRASISAIVEGDGWRGQVSMMLCAQRRTDTLEVTEAELQSARDVLLQVRARLAYIVAAQEEREIAAALERRRVARRETKLRAV